MSSPLCRALQTLEGAFPTLGSRQFGKEVKVWPVASEHLTDSCDIGSGAKQLAQRHPRLDLKTLPEVWWYTDAETSRRDADDSRTRFRDFGLIEPRAQLEARVDQFAADLLKRPESTIAVFGHSDFFNCFLDRQCGAGDHIWLDNAQVEP